MNSLDSLMLDAKQAILDEQHRRFQTLQQEGRWPEALRQIHVTLGCASDLLNESLTVLEHVLETHRPKGSETSAPDEPHAGAH